MSEENAERVAKFNQNVLALKDTLKDDEDQEKFLTAILWLAWLLTAEEEDLDRGFKDSFTSGQADLIMSYASGSGPLPPAIGSFIKALTADFIRSHALWP
jgi:hypothetical protein